MANLRQYAYFLKGNKIAIVENDSTPENDPTSRDYGPGARAIRYKSPLANVTDGLEIEYAYSPKYRINDLDDTITATAYDETTNNGTLEITIPTSTINADVWIVIRGSEKFNGLHQVKTALSAGTTLELKTKYNGGAVTESFTVYIDIDTLNNEDDDLMIPDYLSKAVVYYVKAKMSEDKLDMKGKEYFMKEFKKMVQKYQSSNIWGARKVMPGANAIR